MGPLSIFGNSPNKKNLPIAKAEHSNSEQRSWERQNIESHNYSFKLSRERNHYNNIW